jgi:hypothetical protein
MNSLDHDPVWRERRFLLDELRHPARVAYLEQAAGLARLDWAKVQLASDELGVQVRHEDGEEVVYLPERRTK